MAIKHLLFSDHYIHKTLAAGIVLNEGLKLNSSYVGLNLI
jgi:hypothetical protein